MLMARALVLKRPGLGNQNNCFDYKRNPLWGVRNWIQLPEAGTSDQPTDLEWLLFNRGKLETRVLMSWERTSGMRAEVTVSLDL